MQVTIDSANELADRLEDCEPSIDNKVPISAELLDESTYTIKRLAAGLNWALVALEKRGVTTDVASIKAILNGDVPTDRAY